MQGFNTELEELCRVQQHWSIPDSQLRARVRTENVELVGGLSMLNFTECEKQTFVFSESLSKRLLFLSPQLF